MPAAPRVLPAFRLVCLFTLSGAAAGPGCAVDTGVAPGCDVDGDCAPGLLCRERQCWPSADVCGALAPCDTGERCRDGFCVPGDFCQQDLDCAPGFVCNREACVSGCRADLDCGPQQVCNARSRQCVATGRRGTEGCPRGEATDPVTGLCVPAAAPRCEGDDGLEDNDVPRAAFPIGPGEHTGLTACAGDPDWFSLTVPASGSLLLDLVFPVRGGDLEVLLLDPDGVTQLRTGVPTAYGRRLAVNGLPFGTYLIHVHTADDAGNPYDLHIDVRREPFACFFDRDCRSFELCDAGRFACVPRPGRCTDGRHCETGKLCEVRTRTCVEPIPCEDDRREPDDAPTRARPLPLDNRVAGRFEETLALCQANEDWYSFELRRQQDATLDVDLLGVRAPVGLEVYGPDPNPRRPMTPAATGGATDVGLRITLVAPGAGVWLVRVFTAEAGGPARVPYRLAIELGAPACEDDRLEENDSVGAARALTTGEYRDIVLCGDDADFYAFDVGAGSRISFFVATTAPVEQYDLRLTNAEGTRLLGEGAPRAGGLALDYEARLTQRVILRVFLVRGREAGYELRAAIEAPPPPTPAPSCPGDDDLEHNDEPDRARRILAGRRNILKVCDDDEDWFLVNLSRGNFVRVELVSADTRGVVKLELYAPERERLLATGSSAEGEELIQHGPAREGAHLLRVRVEGDTEAAYGMDLVIFLTEPPPPPPPPAPTPPRPPTQGVGGRTCSTGDDALEQNDSGRAAVEIQPGLYEDLLACSGDDDWYRVRLGRGDRLAVGLGFRHSVADVDMQIRNPADTNTLASSAGTSDAESAVFQANEPGLYLVRVFVYSFGGSPNNYNMSIDVSSPSPNCLGGDDRFDDGAGNDGFATARTLPAGEHSRMVVCTDDPDVYQMDLQAGQLVRFGLVFAGRPGPVRAGLYAADRTTRLLEMVPPPDAPMSVWHRVKRSERHYLKVVLAAGRPTRYDLTLELTPPPPDCARGDDDLEPNDDAGHATRLPPSATLVDRVVCDGASDVYGVVLDDLDEATFTVTYAPAVGEVDLRALGTDGVSVLGTSAGDDGSEELTIVAPVPGTYYFEVSARAQQANTYAGRLRVLTAPPDCTSEDDAFEPDDDAAAAAIVAPGRHDGLAVCDDDEDWYCVALARGDRLRVRAEFLQENGDIDLEIFDIDRRTVLARSTSTDDDEEATVHTAFSGEHCFRVFARGASQGNFYGLLVQVTPGDPPRLPAPPPLTPERGCLVGEVDDPYEPNDTGDDAVELTAGAYRDLLACPLDGDFYSVFLAPGDRIDVVLAFNERTANIDLELVGPGRDRVASSRTAGSRESITYTAQNTGEHLIRVIPGGAENNYNMTIDLVVAEPDCVNRDDALEPNDDAFSPAALPLGLTRGLVACAGDSDYFDVFLDERDLVQVTGRFVPERGDMRIELIDVDRTSVLIEAAAVQSGRGFELVAPYPGVFEVRVAPVPPDDGNFYDLDVVLQPARPSCASFDDPLEPNDTVSNAPELTRGTYDDLVVCHDDPDFFEVFLARGGTVRASVTFDHRNAEVDLHLVAPDRRSIVAASTAVNSDFEEVTYTATAPGVHYVRVLVNGLEGSTRYTLDLDVTGTSFSRCQGEDDAREPNDNAALAAAVPLGVHPQLLVCGDDPDYFAVAADAGGRVDVEIAFDHEDANLGLALLDEGGAILAESDGADDIEHVTWTAGAAAATVVVRVLAPPDEDARYTLSVDVVPPCPGDVLEENDAAAAAVTLPDGDVDGLYVCDDDEDWYATRLAQDERLVVKVIGDDVTRLVLELTGAGGTPVLASGVVAADQLVLDHTATADRDVLVRVAAVASRQAHALQVQRTPPCTGDDAFEENDTFAASVAVPEGTHDVVACATDADYYEIPVQTGQQLGVEVRHAAADGAVSLRLLGADENDVLAQSASGTGAESATYLHNRPDPTMVTIEVRLDAGSRVPYEITVVLQ